MRCDIPIRQSLHRADLTLGAESDLVFFTALLSFLVAFSGPTKLSVASGIFFWMSMIVLLRFIAKKDPIMSKIWRKHINQQNFYPAKTCLTDKARAMSYKDHTTVKNKSFANLLQYCACVDDGIILNKDGSFLAGWEYQSIDTASSTNNELASLTAFFNNGVKTLGDGWTIHVDAVRIKADFYPPRSASHFPDLVTEAIEEERREIFESGIHYETKHVIFVTYKPNLTTEKLSSFAYKKQLQEKGNKAGRESLKALSFFQNALNEIEDVLSTAVRLTRLLDYTTEDETGTEHIYSKLLSHIQFSVTGVEQPIKLPTVPMYLDTTIGSQDLVGGLVPKIGENHLAVIGIDGFPQDSYPMIFNVLDSLSISYRFNSRFICMDQYTAQTTLNKYRATWAQKIINPLDKIFNKANPKVNRDASVMASDTEEALHDEQAGFVSHGFYSANIIISNENQEQLEDACREIRRSLQGIGFGCRRETINCLEAWLGSHPGNSYSNIRQVLINTLNLSHLLPLSSIWTGHTYNPSPFFPVNSPPLLYAATNGSTPFRLNLHVGDLGHTLIFGPTGSGKSTLLSTLCAQFRRYANSNIFIFDKGMSMYPLVSAAEGTHYNIGADDSTLAFCPLQHVSTPASEAWACEYIEQLVTMQGVTVKPNHRIAIHDAIQQISSSPENMRSLSNLFHYIQEPELKEALVHYTNNGPMGRLLDAESDNISMSNFTVFEMEELMNMGEENLIPVLLYLFHLIEKSFKGQPSILVLDEAWIMFSHPVFRKKIREWLKVLRKANCAVIMATQSLSDAKSSGIMDVLNESCQTKIYLPNITATNETEAAMYYGLGLNTRQIEIIATARPKREYYIVSPEGRRLINLSLGPVALSFAGASSKEDIKEIKELEKEHGHVWPKAWLKKRNI
ncbi:conjugal transfer protein TrbD [Desulfotalea psychrophila]|uniref:Probable conjugal transfer protein TrbE n=1 Tax=Desulfotalea psychrophila (strain LSv54 / DSM 12343) TaxID=177439 RepID=Q6AIG9_DESPS|nr:conjugal transfer protein TrbD [Desulfotalea psychrophila]CAG37878.1 probable conjugal transfer protein TrbE [Desulfotalea psychrophila LSv54]